MNCAVCNRPILEGSEAMLVSDRSGMVGKMVHKTHLDKFHQEHDHNKDGVVRTTTLEELLGTSTGQPVIEFKDLTGSDQKWVAALSSVSKAIETSGSGRVVVYGEDGVADAEATLRHFLEVTCNIRIQPDHSGHKVPKGPGAGHDQTRGVSGVNQAEVPRIRTARPPASGPSK